MRYLSLTVEDIVVASIAKDSGGGSYFHGYVRIRLQPGGNSLLTGSSSSSIDMYVEATYSTFIIPRGFFIKTMDIYYEVYYVYTGGTNTLYFAEFNIQTGMLSPKPLITATSPAGLGRVKFVTFDTFYQGSYAYQF
jgi:hypothetical protein